MKRIVVLLAIVAALSTAIGHGQGGSQASLVFTDVTVIDATGAAAKPHMMLIVGGGAITSVEPYQADRVPRGAQIVDARDKFIIPGLWDMHVHWYDERFLPLFIANGVVGTRQMWGMPMHQQWRPRVEGGTLLGPRLVIASPIIDGPNPVWAGSVSVTTEGDARAAVVSARRNGADFIKVYERLPRDLYFAIADQAKRDALPFAGHVPPTVSLLEASDAGQKSVEHLTGMLLAASSNEAELRQQAIDSLTSGTSDLDATRRQSRERLDTFDGDKADVIYKHLARNHTWQVPTLTVLRATAYLDDPALFNDPRLKYIPASLRSQWDPRNDFRFRTLTPEDWALRKRAYALYVQIAGEMQRHGVDLLAGTDVLNPFCFPGFSLHDELALLVGAGLTPMEALQAATRNAARYMDRADSGTVEAGKVADLVLLDADPLDDIHNTQRIGGVTVAGRYYPRAELDRMLAGVEAIARQ